MVEKYFGEFARTSLTAALEKEHGCGVDLLHPVHGGDWTHRAAVPRRVRDARAHDRHQVHSQGTAHAGPGKWSNQDSGEKFEDTKLHVRSFTKSTRQLQHYILAFQGDNVPDSNLSWIEDHQVSEETQAKLQAMKTMVRWLMGMRNNENNVALSTLRLLSTMLTHDGDLMEKGRVRCAPPVTPTSVVREYQFQIWRPFHTTTLPSFSRLSVVPFRSGSKAEMSRLRLQAGCCILKLAQETVFQDLVTLEQFQSVAYLLVVSHQSR